MKDEPTRDDITNVEKCVDSFIPKPLIPERFETSPEAEKEFLEWVETFVMKGDR